ncbi:putative response regulator/chemotaxis protein CheW [Cystobacter fuscus DSM 2262]|uniref:Response regulator/chemotaxis protein CheW n=1 Tax=Cystobacter fuscus (strain ATCC 25194 / DSM 2262 / NBRC 100088 / M29) TaxID=1242864 RepID=S9QV41_CYSF2|nr:response regulator [Cystobacter fuscus]EPX65199.1 putative response regulator/chemotaxis protein CheW [Cystobacter fuscus DSM 2262]
MSLPSLLLVDDSDAILALERAILSGHYALNTASNGREALEKVVRVQPAAILLDLSMPEMDGDEVLKRVKADPTTADIPVIIISSETSRAESCLALGAELFLSKPFRADELLSAVENALENARRRARAGSLALLRLAVGGLEFAIPLEGVRQVLLQPSTRPLPLGPGYISEFFELRGQPVCVLDLARRLEVEHREPVEERKLVILEISGVQLALSVDAVQDPEEYPATDIERRDRVGGVGHGELRDALMGMLRSGERSVPIFDPKAFATQELLREAVDVLRPARSA